MIDPPRFLRIAIVVSAPLFVTGCTHVQSVLVPGGQEAIAIKTLFWTVMILSIVLTFMVVALTGVALWGPEKWRRLIAEERAIYGGGIVLPVVVLSVLLIYGLFVLEAGASRSKAAGEPQITVTGKQWWWKVVYTTQDGGEVTSANELRLPVGKSTAVALKTDDVIHSFWAPQLAGKLDMIPGRTNVIALEPTEAGVSRGQCAEYCGGAHALMAFHVVAMPRPEFDAWLAREATPARLPTTERQRVGQRLFLENGCGACHSVRGTDAAGTIGPDLTHVGSRLSLAAATLPNDEAAFARWIEDNQHIKPDNLMPSFRQFTADELAAVAAYLDSLE
jgi:cytochrome c oxidase subunit 2